MLLNYRSFVRILMLVNLLCSACSAILDVVDWRSIESRIQTSFVRESLGAISP
jgi:hypothetical protein